MTRREHRGSASPATLTASMSAADTAFSISTNTGWPTGSPGPFFVVIDPGTGSEEKVLCSAQSTSVVTVAGGGRGVDGTIAKSHQIGAVVYPVWTAQEADEANEHAASIAAVHGIAGNVVGTTDAQVLTGKTIAAASNTITGLQPSDATLTALAELDTAAGVVVQTGTDAFAKRSVTSSGGTVTVTNPAGTAGNIDLAVPGAVPIGSITMWATATAPTGWLICDGSTFVAATYPALNTLLGGNTLPDLRDRVPVGASGTKVVRSTGGAASVILTSSELPQHFHAVSITSSGQSVNHTHNVVSLQKTANASGTASDNGGDSVTQGTTTGRFVAGQGGATPSTGVESTTHTHAVNGNTGTTPATAAGAFSVQNPYLALNFIIRAA